MTEPTSNSQEASASKPLNHEAKGTIHADVTATSLPSIPNPEASPRQGRRRLTSEYKMRILDELDRVTIQGEKGALLRREGLYSSQVAEWRHQREEGSLSALNRVRGRKKKLDVKDEKINSLEKELQQLKSKLGQAEAVIDIQKKVSEIFGINTQANQTTESTS